MSSRRFDFYAFYSALDGVRRSRGLTWRQVARETDVSASCLTRMAKGSRPDIDTVAALSAWATLDASAFFPQAAERSSLSTLTAYIHQDPALTHAAAEALEQVVRVTYSQLATGAGETKRYEG